jgi:hypothetical protein
MTLTVILMKVSFSYYIPVSKDTTIMSVQEINNVLSIEGYSNEIEFTPNETKELVFHVKSNNDIDTTYLVSYIGDSFLIENKSAIKRDLNPQEETSFIVSVTNTKKENNNIKFDITSGFKGKTIEVKEKVIK